MQLIINKTNDLYSYIVRYDSGFAPNPFYGYCTLATCKPQIRKTAKKGDMIIGFGSKNNGLEKQLIYVMQVSEDLSFEKYFHDERFQDKKPQLNGSKKQVSGDNVYSKKDDEWVQLDCYHSQSDLRAKHIKKDTSINKILIAKDFVYFGKSGIYIEKDFQSSNKSIFPKRNYTKFSYDTDKKMIDEFIKYIKQYLWNGQIGEPYDWDKLCSKNI